MGLGLPIARSIIEAHDGRNSSQQVVETLAEPDFIIELPAIHSVNP